MQPCVISFASGPTFRRVAAANPTTNKFEFWRAHWQYLIAIKLTSRIKQSNVGFMYRDTRDRIVPPSTINKQLCWSPHLIGDHQAAVVRGSSIVFSLYIFSLIIYAERGRFRNKTYGTFDSRFSRLSSCLLLVGIGT